ncbi:hypothetical protein BLNAU_7466 [Blattamonas nauphoetae]|uniref:Uncharacterized protein n=1 Tax=Blattamonas nauphoetae TaxID=2049346 RepID=A0ABQ9Y1E7_9EUKA|nr:hypothetical protein BLNAU_7466 [Blattamonas nauphoetae]
MTEIGQKTDALPSQAHSDLPSPQLAFSRDCSPFLNWDEEQYKTVNEQSVVFRSLVATLKSQPALDDVLETKAVNFLKSVNRDDEETADDFLGTFKPTADDSLAEFVQSIVVLVSSPHRAITTATMKILENLSMWCSARVLYTLVKADLFPQIINTLNPLSLSFRDAFDIHTNLLKIITNSNWLAIPGGLEQLGIEDENGEQTVHKTVLKQVIIPSEKYIWHLCVNRYRGCINSVPSGFLSYEAENRVYFFSNV